ncbi:hypothetical protein [Neisseria leonii]|uniref:hypothetical protein n=1 Tax=Neisseria leonii TaxID=2995413 RepID=UPI00237BAA32|nr:hypothetical protein [Neisseria sp. 3986]MDD9324793.1 hypothetical protein [Neisseria sp. 3986]
MDIQLHLNRILFSIDAGRRLTAIKIQTPQYPVSAQNTQMITHRLSRQTSFTNTISPHLKNSGLCIPCAVFSKKQKDSGMKKSACAILACLSVSGCRVGLIVDETVTDARISSAINDRLNYNKKLNRLLPACLKMPIPIRHFAKK